MDIDGLLIDASLFHTILFNVEKFSVMHVIFEIKMDIDK